MSQRKKLWLKLNRQKTPLDITYSDVLPLLLYFGFEEVYSKGDHVMFKNKQFGTLVGVDSNSKGTLLPCYVKDICKAVGEVIERGGKEL